jgi:acyl carrier protein
MLDSKKDDSHSKEAIRHEVIRITVELLDEWDTQSEASINPETLLGADLAFGSIDIVRLISEIQQLYDHKLIPFQELFMRGDDVIQDLQIKDLVDFLHKHVNS